MQRIIRAIPIEIKEALEEFAQNAEKRPMAERRKFLEYFGGAVEE